MSILVTGARGTIGSYFELQQGEMPEPLDLTDRAELDVLDLDAVMRRFETEKYSAVVHLAAETDVDRCEREPEHAFALNTVGAWNIALAAQRFNVEMLHMSTIGIFGADGAAGPFSEMDEPDPATVYAKTKVAAEQRVRELVPRHYVLRTTWIFGGGREKDRKLVGKFRERLVANEPIKAVDDRIGSLTYAKDLVTVVAALLRTKAYGVYHMTNGGHATPKAVAEEMKSILASSSTIETVSWDAFPHDAPRPMSEASVSHALPARGLGHLVRPWQDALREYLETAW